MSEALSLTFSAATLLVLTAAPVMQTTGVLGDRNRKSRRHNRSHVGAQLGKAKGRQPRIGSQQGVRL